MTKRTDRKKVFVIINKQHQLLPDQERILLEEYPPGEYLIETCFVPAEGWTLDELSDAAITLWKERPAGFVFVSPVPVLIRTLAKWEATSRHNPPQHLPPQVRIFHNDHREKKELPDGRVISVVAKEGWVLV